MRTAAAPVGARCARSGSRDMKKLIAAGMVWVALLAGGCSSGGYGSIGTENLTSFNGNPGGASPPPPKVATAALFQPSAGLLPYPYDVYFAGSTDGRLEQRRSS